MNKIVKLWTTLEYYLLFGIQTLVCSFNFLNRLVGDIPNSRMGKIHIVKELIFQTNLQMYSHSQSKSPRDRFILILNKNNFKAHFGWGEGSHECIKNYSTKVDGWYHYAKISKMLKAIIKMTCWPRNQWNRLQPRNRMNFMKI